MKALITGANGAVGSYMIDYILKEHPEVDLHTTARQDSTYAGHHMMDLRSHKVLNQMIQKQQFDCIFHFACDPDVRKSFEEPVAMLDNNILSTAHLFEAIRKHSPQTKIILASTAEVYGRCSDGKPVTELAPLDPDNPYAVSKVTQDLLARTYFNCYGLSIVRMRLFSYFNPKREGLFSSAFAKQIAEIEAGQRGVLRHGNLESIRTFVDVEDACEAYWLAWVHGRGGEAYNVGSSKAYSVQFILNCLIELSTAKTIATETNPDLLRPTDVKAHIPDSTKFISETGWEPKIMMRYSLKKLLDYWRDRVNESILPDNSHS
jgi:GDP-4-dehydro-6-deoxy-D-mannose reductase